MRAVIIASMLFDLKFRVRKVDVELVERFASRASLANVIDRAPRSAAVVLQY